MCYCCSTWLNFLNGSSFYIFTSLSVKMLPLRFSLNLSRLALNSDSRFPDYQSRSGFYTPRYHHPSVWGAQPFSIRCGTGGVAVRDARMARVTHACLVFHQLVPEGRSVEKIKNVQECTHVPLKDQFQFMLNCEVGPFSNHVSNVMFAYRKCFVMCIRRNILNYSKYCIY